MKYFAYGSNMSLKRLQQRAPRAHPLGTYSLDEHELRFHKLSKDGSGKCDAFYTGDNSYVVMGVLYEIHESEKAALDIAEGVGWGYEDKEVSVSSTEGKIVTAVTYCATRIKKSLRPYSWYKKHVLVGAREANLPSEYRAGIEAIDVLKDPDQKREAEQYAIHSSQFAV